MKTTNTKTIRTLVILIIMITIAGTTFARGNRGGRYNNWMANENYPPPGGQRGWYGQGFTAQPDPVSLEIYKKIDELRQVFFKDTEKLRNSIYAKQLELRSELAKEDPKIETASAIQKELSDLRSKMDQKRLAHQFELRKIDPNFNAGFRMGQGRRSGGRGGNGMGGGYKMGGGHGMRGGQGYFQNPNFR